MKLPDWEILIETLGFPMSKCSAQATQRVQGFGLRQWVQNHDPTESLLSRGQGVGTARPELPDALYGRARLSGDFPGLPWI